MSQRDHIDTEPLVLPVESVAMEGQVSEVVKVSGKHTKSQTS